MSITNVVDLKAVFRQLPPELKLKLAMGRVEQQRIEAAQAAADAAAKAAPMPLFLRTAVMLRNAQQALAAVRRA